MKSFFKIAFFIFVFLPLVTFGQQVRVDGIKALSFPWVGGLNACQFGSVDLDFDGKNDLVVFDRQGNRMSCFVNRGGIGEIRYEFDNQYAKAFPKIDDWMILADYDGDGRNDIFTYSKGWAGIKVFRNVSTDSLAFELVKSPYLTSLQGAGEVNIMATYADYPAIVDVDGDGDLDILTFGVLGTFIEKHQNLSVEKYGTRDSLIFERNDYCWGRVAESEEDNRMYLDTCLFGKTIMKGPFRHRGATVTVRDLNGDGLLDMLLGDVDYPGLIYLQNGGTMDAALMTSQESRFPSQQPVNLFSMSMPFFIDVNNDGFMDMIVSPFDPNPLSTEGQNSIWLYLNFGTNENPDFQLYTKSFLQGEMLDFGTGSYPVFADIDADGLTDMLVGTIGNIDSTYYIYGSLQTHRLGQIAFFKNVGTTNNPVFQLFDDDFGNLKSMKTNGLVPTFGDLNNDGKPEMLVGTSEGNILSFNADFHLHDNDFLHYEKTWSAPCLYDVDADGILDLVVGNANGKLTLYQGFNEDGNVGFAFVTDEWGGVDVRDYSASYFGYSVPSFFKSGTETYLSVGSEQGKMFLYKLNNSGLPFEEISEEWQRFVPDFDNHFGLRCAAALSDLNDDGKLEMIVGNYAGGLQLFNAEIVVNQSVEEMLEEVLVYPNPAKSVLTIVGRGIDQIRAYDVLGRCMIQKNADSDETTIEVDDLTSGIYLLQMNCNSGQQKCLKFIKD
ncbi:MAG: T9SS type A sorting domain-containing protein [Bacteroidales bacterium]|nr:T9SS type A sorting domain-containing protein [Bacteroidales bacterium]